MSDFEDHLRGRLRHDAAGLPDYETPIRSVTRAGKRRRTMTRLGAAAAVVALLGGGLLAYLALRGGDDPEAIIVTQPDQSDDATTDDGGDAAPAPTPVDQPAETDPPDDPTGECLGFGVYCLGVSEEAAVAAGRAEFGPEITGPYFEGEPPGPGNFVWLTEDQVEVQLVIEDGVVNSLSLWQPELDEDVERPVIPVLNGFELNRSTLADVVDALGPPEDVFVGGGEGNEFLTFVYRDVRTEFQYGYTQSWSVGFLDDLGGLTSEQLVEEVRANPYPLNLVRVFGPARDDGAEVNDVDEVDPIFTADLALRGWGEVEVGMSEADLQAIEALQPLDRFSAGDPATCSILVPVEFPQLGFMVTDGIVSRIEVFGGLITTLSGIGIGATETDVYAAYGDRIEESLHPYLGEQGRYLTFVPRDDADAGYRLIFETEDNVAIGERTVTTFRVGQLPQIEWIEGCA